MDNFFSGNQRSPSPVVGESPIETLEVRSCYSFLSSLLRFSHRIPRHLSSRPNVNAAVRPKPPSSWTQRLRPRRPLLRPSSAAAAVLEVRATGSLPVVGVPLQLSHVRPRLLLNRSPLRASTVAVVLARSSILRYPSHLSTWTGFNAYSLTTFWLVNFIFFNSFLGINFSFTQRPFFGGCENCLTRNIQCDDGRVGHTCSPCASRKVKCSNMFTTAERTSSWNRLSQRFGAVGNESKSFPFNPFIFRGNALIRCQQPHSGPRDLR